MFSSKVSESLKYYVYRLIDPRNGETFYIGKGCGNRVFQHVEDASKLEGPFDDYESLKLDRIIRIKNEGLDVLHIIHRHGLDNDTSYEVEGALIDAYSGLENAQGGHGNADRGPMSVKQISEKYDLPKLPEISDKLVLININSIQDKSSKNSILRQTQWCWRIDAKRATKADYVCAVERGVVIGVFIADRWDIASNINFPEIKAEIDIPTRKAFSGKPAPDAIWEKYVGKNGKRISNNKMRHVQNPILYWKI